MNNGSLTDKAMLARLSMTQWSARKTDKRVTAHVHAEYNASADSGRYNKALVSAEALQKVQQIAGAARDEHYKLTLPWRDDGARILPAKAYLDYSKLMRRLRADFENAAGEFCDLYPSYIQDARARLNGMFNSADYPAVEKIRGKFTWQVSIDPLPVGGDFRVELSDEEARRIREDIDGRTTQALQEGLQDAWKRLHEALARVVERLSDPQAIFRDSLIGNLRELCDVLPLLNFADNPDLEAARRAVESKLAGLDPETLRGNTRFRAKAAQDARQIMKDMSAFMGAAAA